MFCCKPPTFANWRSSPACPTPSPPGASAWADANRGGAIADSFLEGPVFDDEGNLYVTDIPFGRIFRIDAAGDWTLVAEYDGEPNGMKFLNDAELLITDYKNGLMRLRHCDRARYAATCERRNSERFKGVNDLMFDSRGQPLLHRPGPDRPARPDRPPVPAAARRPARPAARQRAEPERRRAVARRARALPGRHARQLRLARAAAGRRQRRQGRASSSPRTARAGRTAWRSTSRAA